jgi:hypothetical protein
MDGEMVTGATAVTVTIVILTVKIEDTVLHLIKVKCNASLFFASFSEYFYLTPKFSFFSSSFIFFLGFSCRIWVTVGFSLGVMGGVFFLVHFSKR